MTAKDIIQAYTTIRQIDNTIPDDVLDFMKDSAIRQIYFMEIDTSFEKMDDFLTSIRSENNWRHEFGYTYRCHRYGIRDIQDAYEIELNASLSH